MLSELGSKSGASTSPMLLLASVLILSFLGLIPKSKVGVPKSRMLLLLVDELVVSFHIFHHNQVQKDLHLTDKMQSILFLVNTFYFWHISLLTFLSSANSGATLEWKAGASELWERGCDSTAQGCFETNPEADLTPTSAATNDMHT